MEQPLPQCLSTNSVPRAFFPRVASGCRLSLKIDRNLSLSWAGGLSVATWYDTAWIGGTASGFWIEYLYRSVVKTIAIAQQKCRRQESLEGLSTSTVYIRRRKENRRFFILVYLTKLQPDLPVFDVGQQDLTKDWRTKVKINKWASPSKRMPPPS